MKKDDPSNALISFLSKLFVNNPLMYNLLVNKHILFYRYIYFDSKNSIMMAESNRNRPGSYELGVYDLHQKYYTLNSLYISKKYYYIYFLKKKDIIV